ncbi:exosome complex exonuclease RRP6 [Rhodotorula toruloides]|uniref:Exosome complex exonuclease RRP6 n=1 Tax=Rhodotorula toruloides TaxID=5286 RepID=A0A511KB42_RHOTO|nr:exosome complex exonuclease RRP6 [Rhodotorula toruloides]
MADSITPLLDALQQALVPPTRAAAGLPAASDLQFERTLSRKLARSLDTESERVLSLASRVLTWASSGNNATGGTPAGAADPLDPDFIREGVYNGVTERIEALLEQADEGIEKHLGIGKNRKAGVGAVGAKSAQQMEERERAKAKIERLPARVLHDTSLEKPQKRFTARTRLPIPNVDDHSADGSSAVPLWKPILRRKVNALAGEDGEGGWLRAELYEPKSGYTQTTSTSPPTYTRYAHPYTSELASLRPPPSFFTKPQKPVPHPADSFAKTPFEWVGHEKALEKMVAEIRQVGEEGSKDLAIDLEHHDFRTWSGMTCLMQLSTRKKDYIIDAIDAGVRENLESLNEFFTDPEWIKVLHGAKSDIVWLQRDFGLYIVGLFDTYHATHVLGYAQHSLASLLDMYTDFEPDKRPLPKEMLQYARSDTHYLLSIYDHLRLALHAKGAASKETPSPLEEVFSRSIPVSAITFSLPPFDHETGHFESGFLVPLARHGQLKAYATALAIPTLPIKTGWGPGEAKLEVLREVTRWREKVARDEDESTRYVLSLQGMLQITETGASGRIKEGRDVMQVLGGAKGGVSEVVRRRKEELSQLVKETFEKVTGRAISGDAEGDVDMVASAASLAVTNAQLSLSAEEPAVRPARGIWGDSPVASTSSFHGSASTATAATSGIVAGSSSFFGASHPTKTTSTASKGKGRAEEQAEAVKRVHDSLVLGGGLGQSLQPKLVPTAQPAQVDVDMANQVDDNAVVAEEPDRGPPAALSADHAYVPLTGRLPKLDASGTLATSKTEGLTPHVAPKAKGSDVIVVSSLKDKPKKRRRQESQAIVAPAADDLPGLSSSAPVAENLQSPPAQPPKAKKPKKDKAQRPAPESIVPHDYSKSRSILDAEPVRSTGAERREQDKRQRKKEAKAEKLSGTKGFEIDVSDFRRAPRVQNAPKKGQKSQSFQK